MREYNGKSATDSCLIFLVIRVSVDAVKELILVETKEVLSNIRKANNLSQDEMAEKVFVTRQAVSRWETGETVPNTETLKLISKTFDVSVNTLLGSPRQLICQCCGMPLYEDGVISKENEGFFNEDYCKWCYTDGKFMYHSMQELIDFLVPRITEKHQKNEKDVKNMLEEQLPQLKLWKNK